MKNALIGIENGVPVYSAEGLTDEEFEKLAAYVVRHYKKYRFRDLEKSHLNIFYKIHEKESERKNK